MAGHEDERDARLDGNVAAGLLAEVFCREPSTMIVICAGCGATGPIGTLLAYGIEMGAILRCPVCDTAILRVGSAGEVLWVDLRGAISLRVQIGE